MAQNFLLEQVKDQLKNTTKDKTYDKCLDYLKKRPAVDFFAYVDGEVAFIEIIKRFLENNFSSKN